MEKGTLVFSGVGDEIRQANLRESHLGPESSGSSKAVRDETTTFVREAIMRNQWAKLGGVIGVVYCIAGFVLIFLGWNGVASNDRVEAQLPYVVSGGIAGLALVVLGAALIVAYSLRTDRTQLKASIDELRRTIGAAGTAAGAPASHAAPAAAGAAVVAGASSYHVASCALVAGQPAATPMTVSDAVAAGLQPCRICHPDRLVA